MFFKCATRKQDSTLLPVFVVSEVLSNLDSSVSVSAAMFDFFPFILFLHLRVTASFQMSSDRVQDLRLHCSPQIRCWDYWDWDTSRMKLKWQVLLKREEQPNGTTSLSYPSTLRLPKMQFIRYRTECEPARAHTHTLHSLPSITLEKNVSGGAWRL